MSAWTTKADTTWDKCNASNCHDESLNLEEYSAFFDFDPNLGADQWRLVPYIGWRKFGPVDAYYYDWLDFRRVTRWRWWRW